jgi:predicted 3-demethylubiquinone-9 3-methyltransferase (glyoxalase superfamily)
MPKPYPCLWFDGQAEEAARFYVGVFPNSTVEEVSPAAADTPSGPKGEVLTVNFTLDGQRFMGLNGGPDFTFNESISFVIQCADQAEVDRYWDTLVAGGGEHGPCGWLKDRFGVSWQVVPTRLLELTGGGDAAGAERAMKAMLQMGKIEIAEIERAYAGEGGVATAGRG